MGIDLVENDLKTGRILTSTLTTMEEMKGTTTVVLRILNDLLLYEKMHSHEMVLEFSKVAPIPFLNTIVSPFYLQARRSGVDLRVLSPDSNDLEQLRRIRISIDTNKLGQAIANFVSNVMQLLK